MSNYDGLLAAIILIFIICALAFCIYAVWVVAGFICATFGWTVYNSYAQLYTFVVIILMCSAGVTLK